jgi:hypothetical protein
LKNPLHPYILLKSTVQLENQSDIHNIANLSFLDAKHGV